MSQAAVAFLTSLTEEQYEEATFGFENEERYDWHFIPKDDRIGVRWEYLDEAQRQKATDLMRTTLSEQGHEKVKNIMQLELVLREVENRPDDDERRHPEKYFLSFYGDPATPDPWGWRFEGHHLSLNFSSITGEVTVTPAFMGTNPAIVREGSRKGTEVLKQEQDLGRALVKSLTDPQFEAALIDEVAPDDIVTFVDREVMLDTYEGLPAADMQPVQREQLIELIMVYLNNLEPSLAEQYWTQVTEHGLDAVYFAWAGGTEPGDKHYYRIHAPRLLIEYDNTQNDANHIHTVLRDPENDFGEDLLKQHYEHGHQH